ncbi:Heat shock factor protein [Orchesella cincta]|uniref:Heat shock factor protein n=1 Tax=Orchesella cincta TaxID=48709 RepID=A0A1D2N690_ORCCI|nr:Heat shock factor protein [Orchesella cincta]
MHTLVEVPVGGNGGTHVPAFLAKLWKIVDDPSTNDLICWSDMGNSFTIKNQAKFARDLLPLYYKHNNMASFVRQLNMYGFHKVVSVEQGGLRVDKDEMEFAHPFFLKGQEASLELIKRKIPASKHEESRIRPDSLNKVLLDVRQMKGRQETMDNKLLTMKRENEALWRELASLRQKHAKQTQIVSKLLQFLVGMMSQQTPRLAFKRRMPLMLNDKDGVKQKLSRTDANEPTGPVIHDVTELLESDDSGEDVGDQEYTITSGGTPEAKSIDSSPLSIPSKSPYSEAVVGDNLCPTSPEMLFSMDPSSINPTVASPGPIVAQLQQAVHNVQHKQQQVKPKGKTFTRKMPAVGPSMPSVKLENNVGFPKSTTNVPQTTNNVPTTLYFSAPGVAEPVQVVLSIPNQTSTTTVPTTSNVSIPTPVVTAPATTSSTSGKALNVPQQPPLNVPMNKPMSMHGNGMDAVGRNQTLNPRIFLKANGNVAQEDLDGHLDDVEVGLNHLKDLFKGDEYQVDSDTLIGVSNSRPFNFGAIDPETYAQLFTGSPPFDNTENHAEQSQQLQMAAGGGGGGGEVGHLEGQELVTYNPSLFELAEDDSNFFDESSNIFLDDELESMLTTDRNSLKRQEGQNRGVGQLSFSGVNLNNSFVSGLNTPVVCEPIIGQSSSIPGTSGASKRKRK